MPYSLGVLITFEKTKIIDLGDLTWDKEMQLMCPGKQAWQGGCIGGFSSRVIPKLEGPALVEAVQPRIAIMDNGAKKGGSTATFNTLAKTPGLETLWQLHFSDEAGVEHNSAEEYIANSTGPDAADYLKLTVNKNGSFAVFNSRTKRQQGLCSPVSMGSSFLQVAENSCQKEMSTDGNRRSLHQLRLPGLRKQLFLALAPLPQYELSSRPGA